ncbi:Phage Nin protein, partial [Salmonella enterica subsp. enterica serovar Rissen]
CAQDVTSNWHLMKFTPVPNVLTNGWYIAIRMEICRMRKVRRRC